MNIRSNITLCLTIGRRPELLKQTLESLLSQENFEHIIAINDFRDEETNEVFRSLCPNGTLISQSAQVGHHRAVDTMYSIVKTPYIFHCEDDWVFDANLKIDEAIQLLNSVPEISAVCFRKYPDFHHDRETTSKTFNQTFNNISYRRLDKTHQQWHGYTFNPHIAHINLYRKIGPFANFKKERHISRMLKSLNHYVAYLNPGACQHIGDNESVSTPTRKFWMVRWAKKLIKSIPRLPLKHRII